MIRILIVDDQKVAREKLRYMLEKADDIKVVGIATDGSIALEQLEVLQPDIVLLDVEMPNLNGVEATKIISRKYPQIKVLVLSTFDNQEYVNNSINAGAKGYLLKSLSESELQDSVRFIARGYSQLIGPGLKKQMATVNFDRLDSVRSALTNNGNLRMDSLNNAGLNLTRQPKIDSLNGSISTNKELEIDEQQKLLQPEAKKVNWKKWLSIWAVVNAFVWTGMLFYVKNKAPVYTSEWSLILPGEAKVDLNLPQVGEAKFGVDNTVEDLDPRNNILYLANSTSVLTKAAELVGLPEEEFGEPEIEIVDSSSIITFSIDGSTPQEAQSKAIAIHKAMRGQINFLKDDRASKQTEDFRTNIESEQGKLNDLQQRLNQRKIESDLISPDQVDNLAIRVEDLRQQKSDVERELQEANNSVEMLSQSLGLSTQQADEAVRLQSDRPFQQYLQQYNQIDSELVTMQSKFTDNAPVVINEREKLNQIKTALINRASSILKKPVEMATLEQLNLTSSREDRDRASLAKELITAHMTQQNLNVRNQALERQIQESNSRLQNLAKEQLPLENLQREAEFAQAILTSKVAKSGIQQDFSNFPNVQLLSEPDLPDEPSNSDITASLVSTGAFSVLSLTGLMLLLGDKKSAWQDDYIDSTPSQLNHSLPKG